MKKLISFAVLVFNLTIAVHAQKVVGNQRSDREIDSLKVSKATSGANISLKDSTFMDIETFRNWKIQKIPAESVLSRLRPWYTKSQLHDISVNVGLMFDASYTVDELIRSLISSYHCTISEATFIIYSAYYYYSSQGKTAKYDWPFRFHERIIAAFHMGVISTEQFLKNTNDRGNGFNVSDIFAFEFLFLQIPGSWGDFDKQSFFRSLKMAGYTPKIIYSQTVLGDLIVNQKPIDDYSVRKANWTSYFCKGMKSAKAPSRDVVEALLLEGSCNGPCPPKFTKDQVIDFLKQALYTPGEVLEGIAVYK